VKVAEVAEDTAAVIVAAVANVGRLQKQHDRFCAGI